MINLIGNDIYFTYLKSIKRALRWKSIYGEETPWMWAMQYEYGLNFPLYERGYNRLVAALHMMVITTRWVTSFGDSLRSLIRYGQPGSTRLAADFGLATRDSGVNQPKPAIGGI